MTRGIEGHPPISIIKWVNANKRVIQPRRECVCFHIVPFCSNNAPAILANISIDSGTCRNIVQLTSWVTGPGLGFWLSFVAASFCNRTRWIFRGRSVPLCPCTTRPQTLQCLLHVLKNWYDICRVLLTLWRRAPRKKPARTSPVSDSPPSWNTPSSWFVSILASLEYASMISPAILNPLLSYFAIFRPGLLALVSINATQLLCV